MATPPLTGKACKTAPGSLSYAARCTFTRRSNSMNQLSPAQTSLQQSCTRRDACARAVLQYGQWYILMEWVGMEKNNCVRDVTKRLGKEDECGPSARAPSSPEKKFLFGASLIWSRGPLLSGSSGKVLKNSFPPHQKKCSGSPPHKSPTTRLSPQPHPVAVLHLHSSRTEYQLPNCRQVAKTHFS